MYVFPTCSIVTDATIRLLIVFSFVPAIERRTMRGRFGNGIAGFRRRRKEQQQSQNDVHRPQEVQHGSEERHRVFNRERSAATDSRERGSVPP